MSRIFFSINQIGYVVRDIHASMDNWVRHGVGPWFYIDNVVTDYFRYRGEDSDMKSSVAIANSGDIPRATHRLRARSQPLGARSAVSV
jgi:hypothetical protein